MIVILSLLDKVTESYQSRKPMKSSIDTPLESRPVVALGCAACCLLVFSLAACQDNDGGADGSNGEDSGHVSDTATDAQTVDATDDAGDERPGASVLDHDDWSRIAPGDDPFSMPGDEVDCQGTHMKTERVNGARALGISTSSCNYLTAGQDARASAETGQYLYIRAWHFDLTAPDGATARMALNVGGETVWNVERQIPSESCLFTENVEVTETTAFDAGAPVRFHVRNHGDNEYYLFDVRAVDTPGETSPTSCQ
jgi:hypothetical protein